MARYRTPGIYNANGLWQIGPMIIRWGTDEQKQRWIPNILNADDHWCQGFSEPEAGSDLANLRTQAVRDGGVRVLVLLGSAREELSDSLHALVDGASVVHESAASHPSHNKVLLLQLIEDLADCGAGGVARDDRAPDADRRL
jgi:hypothetical protein